MHRHAPGAAGGQALLAIAALVHRQLQRGAVARVLVAEQPHPVGHRILLRGAGDLVEQGLHHEGGVGGTHAAPPQHRHVELGVMHGQAHRQRVGIAHALRCRGVDAVLHLELLEHGARGDGLADDDVVPGQHLAALVEADARAVQVHGAVVAAPHVVLAAPERAHRRVQAGGTSGLGDLAGLDHEVAAARRTAGQSRRPPSAHAPSPARA